MDPNDEDLWDDFVLEFIWRFRDTREEERAWAQLVIIKMKDDDLDGYTVSPNLSHSCKRQDEINLKRPMLISLNKD